MAQVLGLPGQSSRLCARGQASSSGREKEGEMDLVESPPEQNWDSESYLWARVLPRCDSALVLSQGRL